MRLCVEESVCRMYNCVFAARYDRDLNPVCLLFCVSVCRRYSAVSVLEILNSK